MATFCSVLSGRNGRSGAAPGRPGAGQACFNSLAPPTPLAYSPQLLEIIETSVFTRVIRELLADEEYRLLQRGLVARPEREELE